MTGDTYDGGWELGTAIGGGMRLAYHRIEDGGIPWIWTGVNLLQIEKLASTSRTVTFSTNRLDRTDVAGTSLMEADIQAVLDTYHPGDTVSVVYNATDVTFDITFSADYALLWSTAPTNCNPIFNTVGAFDTFHDPLHSLDARYATSRPSTMELRIVQAEKANGARGDPGSLWVATADNQQVEQEFSLTGYSKSLTMSWYRLSLPGTVCPMTLPWELMFEDV